MSEIAVIYKPVLDLIPYANNSRIHSDAQVAQVAASIKEFGFTNPVLTDGDNGVIAGHGRLLAAQRLGLKTVPVIELSHLSNAQKKAYIIADNKLALNSGWDEELLKIEIEGLDGSINTGLLGFAEGELFDLLKPVDFDAVDKDDQGSLDELNPKMVCCPECGSHFDSRGNEA